jgi:hypothetical protein
MPVAIKFGTKTEKIEQKRENLLTQKIKKKHKTVEVDNIINNPNPAWTKLPTDYQMKTIKLLMNCIQCNLKSLYFIFT